MGQKVYFDRKFRLVAEDKRVSVDLREYKILIENTVKEVAPVAKVRVHKDYYQIDRVTQSQIVQIGKLLAKTRLSKQNAIVPTFRLFEGYEGSRIKEE